MLFILPLFWLEGGDSPAAAEFTRVKGEHEALRQVSVAKKCSISSNSPDDIVKAIEADKMKAAAQKSKEKTSVNSSNPAH